MQRIGMLPLLIVVSVGVACRIGAGEQKSGEKGDNVITSFQPCPLKHGRWKPLPAFTDEFEGAELDPTKWYPRNPRWKGRKPGFFHPKNVTLGGGKMHLAMRHEDLPNLPKGYHTYTSAAVQSKSRVRYGYFEIKARPMDSKGSSAFWFYDHTPEIWTEIDVFEIGAGHPKHEQTVHMNVHVHHTLVNPDRHWAKPKRWTAPADLADSYRVYGLEWNPQVLRFYVDGTLVREAENTHWHQPLTLNFDSETMPNWFGLPELENLPSTFSIEYVRAWRRLDGPKPERWRSCSITFPSNEPRSAAGKERVYRLNAGGEGYILVRAAFTRQGEPARVKLAYENEAFFAAQTARQIERTVRLTDKEGRKVAFSFRWAKHKDAQAAHGYRAEVVDIRPAPKPPAGSSETYDFKTADGEIVRMTLTY